MKYSVLIFKHTEMLELEATLWDWGCFLSSGSSNYHSLAGHLDRYLEQTYELIIILKTE